MIERKNRVQTIHPLSISRQCRLMSLHRSSYYYEAVETKDDEFILMRWIDELHIRRPFLGVRRITDELQDAGCRVNRKKVGRLMRKMGIQALYPKPNTSKKHPQNKVYPYLLRNLKIDRPNQVWATDITYIPMEKGFIYLTVIMDWYSRKILSWRLSNTMDNDFCVDALEEALNQYGEPDIFNSDQGSQYTSKEFTGVFKDRQTRISMDGKGAWRDNVFVERLWRSVKYEEVYLNAYASMSEAKHRIGVWIDYYNSERKHQTLGTTPDLMYDEFSGLRQAA
jgi:putative transposase